MFYDERGRQRCEMCGKLVYRSESRADGAVAAAAERGLYLRSYREPRCGSWHLASQRARAPARAGGSGCLVAVLLPALLLGATLFAVLASRLFSSTSGCAVSPLGPYHRPRVDRSEKPTSFSIQFPRLAAVSTLPDGQLATVFCLRHWPADW